MYVLGAVLFLSIIGLAILSMTLTATRVSVGMLGSATTSHGIDAALEEATARLRFVNDPAPGDPASATLATCNALGTVYTDVATGESFNADCASVEAAFDSDGRIEGRLVHIDVTHSGSSRTVGQAVVRIVDYVYEHHAGPDRPPDTERIVGHSVRVCDWKLGGTDKDLATGCVQ